MKYILSFLICFILFQNLLFSQQEFGEDHWNYPLNSIKVYCQKNLDSALYNVKLFYNEEKKITRVSVYRYGFEIQKTIYNYSNPGLLVSKEFYSSNSQFIKTDSFKYDENNLLIEQNELDKNNKLIATYQYNSKQKPIEKIVKYDKIEIVHTYKYNALNQLETWHLNNLLFVSYEYSNDKLVKELHHEERFQKDIVNSRITYEYNDTGLLQVKKENDKIIEENKYDKDGRIIQQWLYYFGIDSGHFPCSNQLVLLFQYD